jgi:hypothetical protein
LLLEGATAAGDLVWVQSIRSGQGRQYVGVLCLEHYQLWDLELHHRGCMALERALATARVPSASTEQASLQRCSRALKAPQR